MGMQSPSCLSLSCAYARHAHPCVIVSITRVCLRGQNKVYFPRAAPFWALEDKHPLFSSSKLGEAGVYN